MRRPKWLTDDDIAELEVSQTRLWNIHKDRRDYISNNLRRARQFIIYALDALHDEDRESAIAFELRPLAPHRRKAVGK